MLPPLPADGNVPIPPFGTGNSWTNPKHQTELQKKLKEAIPHAKKTAADGRRVALSLLLDAGTLEEKLIVVNWWYNLSVDEKQREFDRLKGVYQRPTVSNNRVPEPKKVVLCSDPQEVLDEYAKNSASGKKLSVNRYRTLDDPLVRAHHAMAKPVRRAVTKLERCADDTMELLRQTPVKYNVSLVLERQVGSPRKTGDTPQDEAILEHPKRIAIGLNRENLRFQ